MIAGGIGAGVFGSLLGLGGGILIVPLLTLGFGLPVREAAAVSLVSVIVTSSAAASVYLQRHTANLRLGIEQQLTSITLKEFARLNNLANRRYAGSVIIGDTNGRFFEPAPGRNWVLGVSAEARF